MNNLRELLRNADPLRHDPALPPDHRALRRQTILAVARRASAPAGKRPRPRITVFVTSALMVIATVVLGAVLWSLFNSNLEAAIRFEVRLAETKPAPGLQKAKVAGSRRFVYLHNQVIVSNNDIAEVRATQTGGPSNYSISIKFNRTGTKKMRQATQKHIGKHLAILLDGQVVMAPVIRSPIGASALITGSYTKTQAEKVAERISMGIGVH